MNAAGALAGRRLLRSPWLPVTGSILAVALFVAAGNWQERRMHAKEALRAQFDAASLYASAPLPTPASADEWPAWRYRPVRVEGEYDAARQFYVDNRVLSGRAGYHVVAPLRLADGRIVLVNRGWVAQGATRTNLPAVPPPAGSVAVLGRINVPATGYLEFDRAAPAGALWQNLDPARYAAHAGIALLPIVIEETTTDVADGLRREWAAPDFGVDRHRGYRLQWYALAVATVALTAALGFRQVRRARSLRR